MLLSGLRSASPMPLAAGTRLDSYEILGLLGAGGMGEVYRARDPALKREVAIKVLPSFVSHDPDRLSRFQHEAQAAAALNDPNILAVHQFGTFNGAPYLVSELLEGSTLRQLLQRGALPVRRAPRAENPVDRIATSLIVRVLIPDRTEGILRSEKCS